MSLEGAHVAEFGPICHEKRTEFDEPRLWPQLVSDRRDRRLFASVTFGDAARKVARGYAGAELGEGLLGAGGAPLTNRKLGTAARGENSSTTDALAKG